MASAAPAKPLKLLHVDDDPINLLVLDQLLLALGHDPHGVGSAREAIDTLKLKTFDAVISDIHMPVIDGVTLAQHLLRQRPELPVFAVTADVMTRTHLEYRALGFAGVLAKPVQLQKLSELLARVNLPAEEREFFAHGVATG